MGDGPIKLSTPLIDRRPNWCKFLAPNDQRCGKLGDSFYTEPLNGFELKLKPRFEIFASSLTRPIKQKNHQWIWKLAIQFAKLIKAADIDINGMAMNGLKPGCHYSEAHPIGKPTEGCNTHYKRGTRANAHLEIRPVAGQNISRAYRFYLRYSKPLIHYYKGRRFFRITTDGIYGESGPNMNAKGPLCKLNNLGPFDDSHRRCEAYERYFNIPLTGSIPQNWVRKYGNIVYALRYPFSFRRIYSHRFLGVWGMVDRNFFRKKGIPYLSFPTEIASIVELLSTIDTKRATHVNLNKPYHLTGQKPHIEWLDLHDVTATILLKNGVIDVPGVGKIVFNRASRKSYLDVRGTAKNITITFYNPAISFIEVPLGTAKIKADGVVMGNIKIVMPSAMDLRYGRKTLADTAIFINGLSAKKLSFIDKIKGWAINLGHSQLGKISFKGGKISIARLWTKSWGIKMLSNGLHIQGGVTSISDGGLSISKQKGALRTEMYGLIDIMVKKTTGSRLDFNVPGLEASGTLSNIHIKGPAHFLWTPRRWKISHLAHRSTSNGKLSIGARLTNASLTHDPTKGDPKINRAAHRKVIQTNMRFQSADLNISDIGTLEFLRAGHPQAKQSRFSHLSVQGVSIKNIIGAGSAWIKLPPWQYLRANFKKLVGSISIASTSVKSNGVDKRSEFKDVILDLKETEGQRHKCFIRLPLLKFSPQQYFIGDPNGRPLKFNCRFNAWLRGGYFRFRSKQRPLEERRPYK